MRTKSTEQKMFHNGNRIEVEGRFNFSHSIIEFHTYYKTIYMSNNKLFKFQIVIYYIVALMGVTF